MITVACCYDPDGVYDQEYVDRLQSMVRRTLSLEHRFHVADSGLPGWWRKLELLRLPGPTLILDLDIVIVRPLDRFVELGAGPSGMRACQGWAYPGINDGVTLVEDDRFAGLVPDDVPADFRSSQEYLDHHVPGCGRWPRNWVASYRCDRCRTGPPGDASIVHFHGRPNPHEVTSIPWVRRCWR